MADNSSQSGTDTIRDKDRAGVKTAIVGTDLNIGGASEVLETAAALADGTANPTLSGRADFGMLWNGTTWDRVPGSAAAGMKVQSGQLPSALVGGRLDVNIGTITGTSVPINNVETLVDNAGFTDGTSKVFPQGLIFDETAGTALAENDVAAPRIDSKRASIQVIEDAVNRGVRAAVAAAADGAANAVGQIVNAQQAAFNGATWDRCHGNWRTTTGDTGAKTATFNGITQTNYDAVGAFICIRLGTVTGTTPAMTPQLQWSPDAGTTWINLGTTAPNLTASNQLGLIMIGPTNWSQAAGATPANLVSGANSLLALNAFLPRTWRMAFTIGGTTPSLTITAIDVNYIGGA
jgi:hypothetical protein